MHPELQNLLRRRVEIIADRTFYDRDPAAHLQALREVSEAIDNYAFTHNREFDPKLRHYLAQASYQKAHEHLSAKHLP